MQVDLDEADIKADALVQAEFERLRAPDLEKHIKQCTRKISAMIQSLQKSRRRLQEAELFIKQLKDGK